MNDQQLDDAWTTLEPAPDRRRRIDARVREWLEAHDTPLAAEWLGLFRMAPLSTSGLLAGGTVSLAAAPPFVWLVRALI